jgi:hypothetical protein
MPTTHHRAVIALAGAAGLAMLVASPDAARAATDGESPGNPPEASGIDHEILGVELPLVSWVWKQSPANFTEGQSRLEAGAGFGLRIARHRWERAYYTPFALGLFMADDTKFAHALTEAGVIVPGSGRRLEVGAALGAGVLRITYSTHCDGACNVGGVGVMFAPVARWLFISRPTLTVGASVRMIVPLGGTHGRGWFGEYNGFGSTLLGGLEVGFGRR